MSDTRRGLPLTKSQREKIFPKLTPAQISRIAAHGRSRSVQSGEVLIEQGDTSVPFFVVITGWRVESSKTLSSFPMHIYRSSIGTM